LGSIPCTTKKSKEKGKEEKRKNKEESEVRTDKCII
jgi:hypothetical protein